MRNNIKVWRKINKLKFAHSLPFTMYVDFSVMIYSFTYPYSRCVHVWEWVVHTSPYFEMLIKKAISTLYKIHNNLVFNWVLIHSNTFFNLRDLGYYKNGFYLKNVLWRMTFTQKKNKFKKNHLWYIIDLWLLCYFFLTFKKVGQWPVLI